MAEKNKLKSMMKIVDEITTPDPKEIDGVENLQGQGLTAAPYWKGETDDKIIQTPDKVNPENNDFSKEYRKYFPQKV